MAKKLFIVSDVHGYYTPMARALADAGFDKNNEAHVFVSLGDLFDRGTENTAVYNFVKSLERKILIRGNHEDMLVQTLDRGCIDYANVSNGSDVTVDEFLGGGAVDSYGKFDVKAHADKIAEIKSFIASMSDYYENGKYVFAHGWLPVVFEGRYPTVDPDWRDAPAEEWSYARELGWHEMYAADSMLEGKVIVCGHRATYIAHLFDESRATDCSDIFYGDGVIAIDAGTYRTGRVNVLVIEVNE